MPLINLPNTENLIQSRVDADDVVISFLETMGEALILVRKSDARIVRANRSACDLLGYIHPELNGTNIHDISITISDLDAWNCYHRQALDAQRGSQRLLFNTRSNQPIALNDSSAALRVGGQDCVMMNLRRAEQRAHTNRDVADVADLCNFGPVVVFAFRTSPDLPVQHVTPNVANLIGTDAQTLINGDTKFVSLIHPDDIDSFLAEMRAALAGNQPHVTHQPYRIKRADATYRWVYQTAAVHQRHDGTDSYLNAFLIDITERIRAEEALRASEERLKLVLQGNNEGWWDWNIPSGTLHFSHVWETMLGFQPGDLPNHVVSWEQLIHPEDLDHVMARLNGHLAGGSEIYESEHRIRNKDNTWTWVRSRGKVVERDRHNRPVRMVGTHSDISASKAMEYELKLSSAVFEHTHEGVMITDGSGHIVAVNNAFTNITGYAREESLGETPALLRSGRQGHEFYRQLWRQLLDTGNWSGEIWNRRKQGDTYPQWLDISAVRNTEGRVDNYVAVFSDITPLKESEAQLHRLAYHDALTGLPNRILFRDRIEQAIARADRLGEKIALLFIDLDRFKNINDSLGHNFGDDLLLATAQRLVEELHGEDTVARIGGDEFTIIVDSSPSLRNVGRMAAKLIELLKEPFLINEQTIYISASIGISIFPDNGKTVDELTQAADTAMYKAKDNGRCSYQFYTPEMTNRLFQQVVLEADLRRALEQQEFRLFYQPQVDLTTGKIIGAEALIRWQHPEMGLVPPVRFLGAAEESGLIVDIGTWVLREACRQAREWLDNGLPIQHVAVNLAGRQIQRNDLPDIVAQALRDSGLSAEYLELEIVEEVIMAHLDQAVDVLTRTKQLGVTLALDDFGTGYSSLGYLKRLPVDQLKIDRSLIGDIPLDRNDEAIARAVIAMGHSLGLVVTAEGVENSEQREFLIREGCDRAQGWLYSPPLASEVFDSFLLAETTQSST